MESIGGQEGNSADSPWNFEDEENNPFRTLPIHVQAQVLSLLDLDSKKTARLVSPAWKEVMDSFVIAFHIRLINYFQPALRHSGLRFRSVTATTLCTSIPSENCCCEDGPSSYYGDSESEDVLISPKKDEDDWDGEWTFQAKELRFQPFDLARSFSGWPHLNPCCKWLPFPSKSANQLLNLLTRCPALERLVFLKDSLAIDHHFLVPGFTLPALKSLEIYLGYDPVWSEKQRLEELARISTPALEILSLDLRISLCSREEAYRFYSLLITVIVDKSPKLRSLTFVFDVLIFPKNAGGVVLGKEEEESVFASVQTLSKELDRVKLKHLKVTFSSPEGIFPFVLGITLLSLQTTLISLEITLLNDCSHIVPHISLAIRHNSKTLLSLSLLNGSYGGKWLPPEILEVLPSCTQLRSLEIRNFKLESLGKTLSRLQELVVITLAGTLHPRLLDELMGLMKLEELGFRYHMSVNSAQYPVLEEKLRRVIRKPGLRRMKVLVGGLALDFFLDEPGIRIDGSRNGLHECVIRISDSSKGELSNRI